MLIPNRAMPLFKMFTCFRLFLYGYDSGPWKRSLYLVILLYGDWLFELSLLHSPGCFQPAGRNRASYSEKSQEYAAAFRTLSPSFLCGGEATACSGWVGEPAHCPPHTGKFSSLKSPQWNATSKAPTGAFWATGRVELPRDQEVSAAVNKDTEVQEWLWKEGGRIQRSGAMAGSGSEGSKEVRGVAENSYVAAMTWFLEKRTF